MSVHTPVGNEENRQGSQGPAVPIAATTPLVREQPNDSPHDRHVPEPEDEDMVDSEVPAPPPVLGATASTLFTSKELAQKLDELADTRAPPRNQDLTFYGVPKDDNPPPYSVGEELIVEEDVKTQQAIMESIVYENTTRAANRMDQDPQVAQEAEASSESLTNLKRPLDRSYAAPLPVVESSSPPRKKLAFEGLGKYKTRSGTAPTRTIAAPSVELLEQDTTGQLFQPTKPAFSALGGTSSRARESSPPIYDQAESPRLRKIVIHEDESSEDDEKIAFLLASKAKRPPITDFDRLKRYDSAFPDLHASKGRAKIPQAPTASTLNKPPVGKPKLTPLPLDHNFRDSFQAAPITEGTLFPPTEGTLFASTEGTLSPHIKSTLPAQTEETLFPPAEGTLSPQIKNTLFAPTEGFLSPQTKSTLFPPTKGPVFPKTDGAFSPKPEGTLFATKEDTIIPVAKSPRSPPQQHQRRHGQSSAEYWQEYSEPLSAMATDFPIKTRLPPTNQSQSKDHSSTAGKRGELRDTIITYPIRQPPAKRDVPYFLTSSSCCLMVKNEATPEGSWFVVSDRAAGNKNADWRLRTHIECNRPDDFERYISIQFGLERYANTKSTIPAGQPKPSPLIDAITLQFSVNSPHKKRFVDNVRPLPIQNLRFRDFEEVYPKGSTIPDAIKKTAFPSSQPKNLMVLEWNSDRGELITKGGVKGIDKRGYIGPALTCVRMLRCAVDIPSQIRLICYMPEKYIVDAKSLVIPYLSYGADVEKHHRDDRRELSGRQRQVREGTGSGEDGFTQL